MVSNFLILKDFLSYLTRSKIKKKQNKNTFEKKTRELMALNLNKLYTQILNNRGIVNNFLMFIYCCF